ncbi:P-loop containing nucleoside triphosphate hydrolase protein [Choiromyces venosus 120613-1]|uniref:ATP-dependent RNA helicase ROK1 n=1 Tax=Choiromyces venosus 120613-1 TaxID=1336337 RepID=A0A3N4K6H8_9PEZI|nr:P-loop containing nucleoside triphosphate hydrolase protein [Choiromyces venosus 120613-1]
MADIFRLLTRSTTFAKGAGSAAATANTKAKANKPTTTTTITTAITPSSSGALPGELDFFGTGIKRSRDEIDDEGNSHSDRGGDGEEEELGLREPPFTLLESPNADEDKQKKEKKKKEELIIQPLTSFTHLHKLSPRLHRNMRARGYQVPTEVQMGAIPVISRGENLICCAPTGSGKTMAFMVPVLDWILAQRRDQKGKRKVRAVVVAPTKELAGQIVNEGKKLALGTGVRVALLKKGGEGVRSEIVVSTPAVLLHSLEASSASPSSGKEEEEKKKTDWSSVSRLILDEADILLDPLFRAQTLGIWTKLQTPHLRTFLFSATISSSTETLCRQHISPSHTSPSSTIRLIVGLKDTTTHNISQKLTYTATEAGKLLALRQLFTTSFHPPALIFVQTIPRARALVAEILYDLPTPGRIAVLHAELSDVARAEVMSRFLAGEIWVLVTTDLLARGVDFRGVRCVVNYDIPTSVAGYIHRVGRMGRSGGVEGGSAVTYYTEGDVQFVKGIAGVIAKAQGEEKGGEGRWLLDALPKVGKIAKERLKKRGVEARSKAADGKEGRISTKSGYERRREDRRRGAVEGSKRRKVEAAAGGGGGDSDGEEDDEEEFVGIQDLD